MKLGTKGSKKTIAVVAVIVAAVLIFGSTGVIKASNSAKPGDVLYPIDTAIENVRLGITNNPESQVDYRTKLVAERINEAQQLLEEQGAGAPGIDIALANLKDQRVEIAKLIDQNEELQSRIDDLESQLEDSKKDLEDAFQLEGESIEDSIQEAKDNEDSFELDRLEDELDELEEHKNNLEEAETPELKEASEVDESDEDHEQDDEDNESDDEEDEDEEN